MESLAIIEDLDVDSNRLPCVRDGRERRAVDELILERREERFRQCIVPADPGSAHRPSHLMSVEIVGELAGGVLGMYWVPRSEWKITGPVGRRAARAMSRASVTRLVRMWSATAHPTTAREYRSITVAV